MDLQLERLRDAVSYLEYCYERTCKGDSKEFLNKINSAKENLKRYKQKHYPEMLVQPTNSFKYEPFVPMSQWSEQFEEYEVISSTLNQE